MVTIRSSTNIVHGHVWVMQNCYLPCIKVQITHNNGSVVDYTNYVTSCSVSNGTTDMIGNFKIKLSNNNGEYTNLFLGGETVDIWMGYYGDNAPGLIKQMSGQVTDLSFDLSSADGHNINLGGTAYGEELVDTLIIRQYENREASDIITNVTDGILSGTSITSTNVLATSTTFSTLNFRHLTRWECIRQMCQKIGYDAYVDVNKDLHFYPSGSNPNIKEAAVLGDNIITLSTITDWKRIKNKIWMYGNNRNNDIQFIQFKEDLSSQEKYGVKEIMIEDSSIDSMDESKDRIVYELNDLKDAIQEGNITCLGMCQLNPGDSIYISSAPSGCTGLFVIKEYTHNFSKKDGFKTSITFGKEPQTLDKFLKERTIQQTNSANLQNPNAMTRSFVLTFMDDTDIESLDHMTVDGSGLILVSGFDSGSMISSIDVTDANVSYYELRVDENADCALTTYDVSLDGGNTWDVNVSKRIMITPSLTSGKNVVLKINMNSSFQYPNPKISGIALLTK